MFWVKASTFLPDKLQLQHPKYRPDIDGLRAIAVLAVVGFHAFPTLVRGGFVGVDVFFVISGFLITTIIFDNIGKDRFSFWEFYQRRIRRIFPALSVVMIFCLLFGWFALVPQEYQQLGKHVLAGSTFVSNFALWSESGYFDTAAASKILLHLWSLGIEEQFYLLWPLCAYFIYKQKYAPPVVFVYFLALVSFTWNAAEIDRAAVATFYSPVTRMWELLLGSLLALNASRAPFFRDALRAAGNDIAAACGLALILIGLYLVTRNDLFPGWWALLPTIGASLLIFSGNEAWINKNMLSNRVLVWFGLVSFPLYLWHWPLLAFERLLEGGTSSSGLRAAAVVVAILLSWATYQWIERPVRFGGYGDIKAVAMTLLMTMIGAAGLLVYQKQGFPSHNAMAAIIQQNNWDNTWTKTGCAPKYLEVSRDCRAEKSGAPTVVLIGDSHSQQFYPGMAEILKDTDEKLMRFGTFMPFFDTAVTLKSGEAELGGDEADRELQFAMAAPSVKAIVIAFRGIINLDGSDYVDGAAVPVPGRALRISGGSRALTRREVFETAMRRTMERLANSGKQVVFVVYTPELGFDPMQCVDIRPIRLVKTEVRQPCAVARRDFDNRNRDYRQLVLSVLKDFPSIKVFDTAAQLCDHDWCWALRDGKLLFMDPNHLSVEGSRRLSRELVKTLSFDLSSPGVGNQ